VRPATYDMQLYQGATFDRTLTFTGINLTGYEAAMQIRARGSRTLLATLTTGNSKIVITPGADSTLYFVLTDEETALLQPQVADYDLEMGPIGGRKDKYLRGKIDIVAEFST
jgi:hypothetical protein